MLTLGKRLPVRKMPLHERCGGLHWPESSKKKGSRQLGVLTKEMPQSLQVEKLIRESGFLFTPLNIKQKLPHKLSYPPKQSSELLALYLYIFLSITNSFARVSTNFLMCLEAAKNETSAWQQLSNSIRSQLAFNFYLLLKRGKRQNWYFFIALIKPLRAAIAQKIEGEEEGKNSNQTEVPLS